MTDHTSVIRAYQHAIAECSGRTPRDVLTDKALRGMLFWCAFRNGGVPMFASADYCKLPWRTAVDEAHMASESAIGVEDRIKTTAQWRIASRRRRKRILQRGRCTVGELHIVVFETDGDEYRLALMEQVVPTGSAAAFLVESSSGATVFGSRELAQQAIVEHKAARDKGLQHGLSDPDFLHPLPLKMAVSFAERIEGRAAGEAPRG